VHTGLIGCSPDSLVGEDGLLEIKTKMAHIQLDVLLKDQVPTEHMAQLQGALLVTNRTWVDFVSYWPNLPLFVKRVYRDQEYLNKLTDALCEFNAELNEIVKLIPPATVKRIKQPLRMPNEFSSLD
jgi:predicted phage-related endonuclease